MSLNCPNCGAHLTFALAEDSRATSAAAAAAAPRRKLVLAEKAGSHDVNPTDADLQRLKHFMCFPFNTSLLWKPTQPTMRPVVSDKEEEVGILKDCRARQTLDRVARKMHATIRACGEQSADTLLESRRRGRAKQDLPVPMHTVFEAVGAIIYAMEWTSGQPRAEELVPTPAGTGTVHPQAVMGPFEPGYALELPSVYLPQYTLQLRRLFEHMLVIDYGFPARPICGSICGPMLLPSTWFLHAWSEFEIFSDFLVGIARVWRWRQGLPNDKSWGLIAEATRDWAHYIGLRLPVWDVATMIYYYCLHRKPVDAEDRKEGWTGYTGVLQEMIAEVPTRGTDRLERKLSLDVHLLIPRFVRDRKLRGQMLLIAQDLAAKYGCQLAPPKMPKPPMWRRLFGQVPCQLAPPKMPKPPMWRRLFGQVPSQQGPEDREKGHEDLKLLEGLRWESRGEGDLDPSCAGKKSLHWLDVHKSVMN
ncbi:hypothetical protein L209DRAFT_2237 [Thermothelomyces heterothallicus CBS 203.75]